MASNGLTSNPDEYLKTFPEMDDRRHKKMAHESDEDSIEEEYDEVDMCMNI